MDTCWRDSVYGVTVGWPPTSLSRKSRRPPSPNLHPEAKCHTGVLCPSFLLKELSLLGHVSRQPADVREPCHPALTRERRPEVTGRSLYKYPSPSSRLPPIKNWRWTSNLSHEMAVAGKGNCVPNDVHELRISLSLSFSICLPLPLICLSPSFLSVSPGSPLSYTCTHQPGL